MSGKMCIRDSAGMLGFRQRDYLEAREDKADMPSMKG